MSEPSLNFHIQSYSTQFRIPTELVKKNFKTIQKLVEKQKKQMTDDVAKIKKNSNIPTAMKLAMVRKCIKSFEGFQKKLRASIAKDEELRSRLIARIEHLGLISEYCITQDKSKTQLEKPSQPHSQSEETEDKDHSTKGDNDKYLDLHNPNLITWYRDQTNLLIIDYLIKSNTRTDHNIGLLLLKSLSESNPKYMKLIDYDLFESFNKVYVSIMEDHDLTLVIAWFNENRNFLKKANSNLEFEINYCRFLSLIENGDVNEAIKFSSINLSPYGNVSNYSDTDRANHEHNLNRLKEIGGLLVYMAINEEKRTRNDKIAFSSNLLINSPRFHEYEKLLSDERWDSLSMCFVENFTKLYGISKNYPIFIYLSAGLASLKTKSCYHNTENTIFRENQEINVTDESIYKKDLTVLTDKKYRGSNQYYKLLNKINNCPVCSPELYKLSRNLPYAQLITSIFNNPFKLPNGNIYPFDKLLNPSEKYLSEKNTLLRMGKIKDPLTREIFLIDTCIRVYPA